MDVVGDDGASEERRRDKEKTNRRFGGRLASLYRSLSRSPWLFWFCATTLIGVVSGQTEECALVSVVVP